MNENKKKKYRIYDASISERKEIVAFFENNWKKSQILEEEYFKYYYCWNDKVTFVIARTLSNSEIVGAYGYIMCSNDSAFGSNFLVKKGTDFRLAFELINYTFSKVSFMYVVSLNEKSRAFYNAYRDYTIEAMECYYKLFDNENYKIACISKPEILHRVKKKYPVKLIKTEEQCRRVFTKKILQQQVPYKSIEYIIKRYFRFPYIQFHYDIWGIQNKGDEYSTFIVLREQEIDGVKICRIVDIIGSVDELSEIGGFFEELGNVRNYEYIDCFCYGIPESIMREMGFVKVTEDNIIPNRLEPIVKENEKIYFFTPQIENFRLFHADGDMDRPNLNKKKEY